MVYKYSVIFNCRTQTEHRHSCGHQSHHNIHMFGFRYHCIHSFYIQVAHLTSSSFSAMSEHLRGSYSRSSPPELRLLLLGNIGCGKTSSADTILGQLSTVSFGVSKSCQLRQGSFEDRSVTLVEAPRWYWSGGKVEDSVRKETAQAMTLLAPGPHAILLLVPVNQFTEVSACLPFQFYVWVMIR